MGNNSVFVRMAEARRNSRDNSKAGFEKREKRRQIRGLQEAIDKHDIVKVVEILQDDFDVDFQYRSQTALQLAVREGCLEICKVLVNKGANVNMADAEQNNLLNMACWRGYIEIAQLLIENFADMDMQNINGHSPMHTCALKERPDILQLLIAAGGDPNVSTTTCQSALHLAVQCQNLEAVQLLVVGGCRVDKPDENRKTPLIIAAELGFTDVVQILINGGANINHQDKTGMAPLLAAVSKGHINIVRELITSGADVDLPSTKGVTPLLESIQNGFTDISLFLIDANCDVNKADRLKQAPIHSAVSKVSHFFNEKSDIREQDLLLVKRLVDVGCVLDMQNQQGQTAVYQSAAGGNFELTQYFLESVIDLSVLTNTGDSLLHAGVHGNCPEVVNSLIKAGCDLNTRNNAGEHPLLTAVISHTNILIIESLINAGSDLNIRDRAGSNSALHCALLHYYHQAAVLLLEHGCDVNCLNAKDNSPLYVACEKNDDKCAKMILENPTFSRTIFSKFGVPQPLFAAVSNNHIHLIELLLNSDCDINMVNIDGLSPVQVALHENFVFIVKLLLKYNCDLDAHTRIHRLYKCCLQHEDSHPHFDLEPLFMALTHRSVEMMQLIIRCYWQLPWKTIEMLNEVFKSTPDLHTHYSPALKREIQAMFNQNMSFPRSLQESCRAVVRSRIGSRPHLVVDQLPCAEKLKDYILMEEEFGDLESRVARRDREHPPDFHTFVSPEHINPS